MFVQEKKRGKINQKGKREGGNGVQTWGSGKGIERVRGNDSSDYSCKMRPLRIILTPGTMVISPTSCGVKAQFKSTRMWGSSAKCKRQAAL
jgi:hypothetical protein